MSVFAFTGLVQEVGATWRHDQVSLPVCADSERVEETLFAEPPAWMRIEQQGNTNTCAANSGSSCMEKLAYMRTKNPVQLCRNYLYLRGQQKCGLAGRDQGCTLGGIIKAMRECGCCEESLWPFVGQYQQNVPPGCDEAAQQYRVIKTLDVEPHGYQGYRDVIGQNIGAVLMACSWPVRLWDGYIVEEYAPQGSGGHAIAALFLSTKKDSSGAPYVWVANSHSVNSQRGGWMLWSPKALNSLVQRDSWGITGVTDMLTPRPRKFDWAGGESFFA